MAACNACSEALVFRPDDDGDDIEQGGAVEVPDDLELPCGCHFHWQCLLDEAATIALSLKCPNCETYLPSNDVGPSATSPLSPSPEAAILAQYKNEGGFQPDLDILPAITEEAYLDSHPEARPARAFQTMCSEGDVDGIVELLAAVDGDNESVISVVQYQDPLSGMKSGLHMAIEQGQVEVTLLLLWLSSTVPSDSFPEPARRVAEASGVGRIPVGPDQDIRVLKDSTGQTAKDVARRLEGPWLGYLDGGLL